MTRSFFPSLVIFFRLFHSKFKPLVLMKDTTQQISSEQRISRFSSLSMSAGPLPPKNKALRLSEVTGIMACKCFSMSGYSQFVRSMTAVRMLFWASIKSSSVSSISNSLPKVLMTELTKSVYFPTSWSSGTPTNATSMRRCRYLLKM